MQAQDYAGAKWGLGQRVKNVTDESAVMPDSSVLLVYYHDLKIGILFKHRIRTSQIFPTQNL